MANIPDREHFMKDWQKAAMGNLPRTHENCRDKTKVARPGKTAQDRARREAVKD